MKVFISWSGNRSKAVANALKDWIPLIVQHAKPWVSDKDIQAGDRWAQAIAGELETSNFGILCITPENLSSEWILFEAGALSKAMQDAKVIPLLFGLELSDLSGPLSQFQALKVDQQGMLKALKAINEVSDAKTDDATIDKLVPALWSQLKDKLDQIPDNEVSARHMRPQTEILEDLVTQVRGLGARMREFDQEMMERELGSRNRNYGKLHPRMVDELMMMSHDMDDSSVGLLIIAGLLREPMPWLSEVLVESYRDLKNATPEKSSEIAHSLMRIVKQSSQNPIAARMSGGSKSAHIMMRELPHLIDRALMGILEAKTLSDRKVNVDNEGMLYVDVENSDDV